MGRKKTRAEKTLQHRLRDRRRNLVLIGIGALVVLGGNALLYVFLAKVLFNVKPLSNVGPRLAVDTEVVDLGSIRAETTVQARFLLRNVGDLPLQIAANPPVEAVEGCCPPQAVVGATTLQPQQETDVTARFTAHAGMQGPHLFVIRLRTNDAVEAQRSLRIRSLWQE